MKRHAPVSHGEIRYLYVRIRARAALAASPGLAGSAATGSIEKVCEFALEVEVGGIREFAARDNDDIDAGIGLQMTEQFACKSLGPVSNNRPANLACRRDTETGMLTIVALDEHRHESPTETNTGLVGSLEIRTASDVLCRPESGHDALSRRRVGTACRRATARRRRSTAFALSRDGASGPAVRLWSPSGPRIHGSACGAGCLVETYAYPSPSMSPRETSDSSTSEAVPLHVAHVTGAAR